MSTTRGMTPQQLREQLKQAQDSARYWRERAEYLTGLCQRYLLAAEGFAQVIKDFKEVAQ